MPFELERPVGLLDQGDDDYGDDEYHGKNCRDHLFALRRSLGLRLGRLPSRILLFQNFLQDLLKTSGLGRPRPSVPGRADRIGRELRCTRK